jgi:hypothetical protein
MKNLLILLTLCALFGCKKTENYPQTWTKYKVTELFSESKSGGYDYHIYDLPNNNIRQGNHLITTHKVPMGYIDGNQFDGTLIPIQGDIIPKED